MDNKNSSATYTAKANDNISKIAAEVAANGGLMLTDRSVAASSYTVELFLSGGNLYALHTGAVAQLSAVATW